MGHQMKNITEDLLYCMAMESDTAHKHMQAICAALGMPFPPRLTPPDTAVRDALPCPFTESETA